MANLDEELIGYYEDQELDAGLLDQLASMDPPKRRPWKRWVLLAGGSTMGLGVAAAALLSLTVLTSYRSQLSMSSPAEVYSAPSTDALVDDWRPRTNAIAPEPAPSVLIIQGSQTTREAVEGGRVAPRPRPAPVRPRPMAKPSPAPSLRRETSGSNNLRSDQTERERLRRANQRAEDARRALAEARKARQAQEKARLEREHRERMRKQHPQRTPSRTSATSTFAVDTDTGAWSRSHASLMRGFLPAPHEVRTEEFLNAFRYEYEPPSDEPFAVNSEVVPSPFDTSAHLVRIGLQGEKVSVFDRKPVHLTFLVDVSGSMSAADKLPLAQKGMKMLLGELRDGDTVAIVTYAGRTGIHLEPTSVGDRQTIERAMDSMMSGGSTAMGAGIDLAYGLADRTLEPGAINRVVLISDGDANVGERDADKLAQRLRKAADRGITLTTLGFGNRGYRDDVMERLANKGDGQYHWIGNERQAKRVLVDHLTGMLQTIARDVKIQVQFDPAVVKSWRLIGYENRRMANRDFRNDKVDAGEVGADHQVTALYEVELLNAKASLGRLRLRYEAPGAEGSPAAERSFSLGGGSVASLSQAGPDTRLAVVAATFAERLRGRPGPALATLLDLLPDRPEYRERDGELADAIVKAKELGL